MTDELKEFYAEFTPLYHLVYEDWEKSVERQASMLDALIREKWGEDVESVLDVSCGIGTQALGLAALGYEVTASDLSPESVERAQAEAGERGLPIGFSAADMRDAFKHHGRQFDVVISCDNAIPHLLTDEDILAAFCQIYECCRPGGGCLVSVRDYEQEDRGGRRFHIHGSREHEGTRYFVFQVRDFQGDIYDLSVYFVEEAGGDECKGKVIHAKYYAIGIPRLLELMGQAGFEDVERVDGEFFQPVLIGQRRA